MFIGPLEQVKPWSTRGVEGTYRFLNRVWRLFINDKDKPKLKKTISDSKPTTEQLQLLHQTIEKVTNDIEELKFNTAIAALMEFTNNANKWEFLPREIANNFVLLLAPLSPHLAEELWEHLGNTESLAYMKWPETNQDYLKNEVVEVIVQVNGKMRGRITIPIDTTEETILTTAKNDENVARHLSDKKIVKSIYVPGRIVNFVTRN
ncbi:MAG: hypothetical protein CMM56_07015 [Rhodospirillaceae bacterium]|nr:hypothetical protein [Rhodospirillaceae bacterium]